MVDIDHGTQNGSSHDIFVVTVPSHDIFGDEYFETSTAYIRSRGHFHIENDLDEVNHRNLPVVGASARPLQLPKVDLQERGRAWQIPFGWTLYTLLNEEYTLKY